MKPYLLIVGDTYYPESGTGDWIGCYKTEEEAKEETKRATRQYARRQETWFSRDERITWISPTQNALQQILESIN